MQEPTESRFLSGMDLEERGFFDQRLLATDYAKRLRELYVEHRSDGFDNPHRNYTRLLFDLTAIFEYNANHGRSYHKPG